MNDYNTYYMNLKSCKHIPIHHSIWLLLWYRLCIQPQCTWIKIKIFERSQPPKAVSNLIPWVNIIQKNFITWFKCFSLAWKHAEGSDYLFSSLFLDLIFLWERQHVDRSLWKGAWGWEQFFSKDLFSKRFFHHMIQMISFFSLA